jgi:Zn-dependent protease with chaperone function
MKVQLITLKMAALIFGVCLIALFTGYQLGSRWGLLLALILSALWMTLLWASDEARWLNDFRWKRLSGQDAWGLLKIIELGATRLHMIPPDVYLVSSRSAFAFSISFGLSRETILVSEGLLENLTPEEIETVLFSELSSLYLRKQVRYRWVHLCARSVVRFFEVIESLLPFGKKWGYLRVFALPFNYLILKIGLWKNFELERDKITISMVPDRRPLASALSKLVALGQVYPVKAPAGSQHLFIVSPTRTEGDENIFALHSPLPLRLRRILGAETI